MTEARYASELQLVLLCAAGEWADDRIRRLSRRELRWPWVVALAGREQATSVLVRRLKSLGVDTVPPEHLEALERIGLVEEFRMSTLEERLDSLIDLLQDQGIQIVLLKGAGIALQTLGSLRERPMSDLDLLVRDDQAATAFSLAVGLDWVERGEGFEPGMYVDMQHLLPLKAGDGLGFGLEIHTDLFPRWNPFAFSAKDVWRQAVPLSSGSGVLVPTPEHQLLHTCLHFAWSHSFRMGTWRMVRDLDALLAHPELDERRFAELAHEARGTTCVYWTLSLLNGLTRRSLPERLMTHLNRSSGPLPGRSLLRRPLLSHLTSEALSRREFPGTRGLRRFLWSVAIGPGASGHGAGRPWTGAERWPTGEHTRPLAAGSSTRESWATRLQGLLAYSRQILALWWVGA